MSKFAPLLFAFVVMASVGLILEVVRFHAFTEIHMNGDMDRLPKLSWFFINLPSTELYSRYQVYLFVFLLPWLTIVWQCRSMTAERLWHVCCVRAILALAIGGLVATAMISPCIPRMTRLKPEDLPSTRLADGIALIFALLSAAVLIRILLGLRKHHPSNK